MTDRVEVQVSRVHRILLRDQGGWIDIVPGSLNFVYVSLWALQEYLQEFGSYTFTTENGQIFHIPAEAMIGLQLQPLAVVEDPPPPEEDPPPPEEDPPPPEEDPEEG
jgi:hypothetical protein